MGNQAYSVHIFTYVDKIYGDKDIETFDPAEHPVLANPPWTLMGQHSPQMTTSRYCAKQSSAGQDLHGAVSHHVMKTDPTLAREATEIGMAVGAAAATDVEAPPGLEAEAKARTARFLFLSDEFWTWEAQLIDGCDLAVHPYSEPRAPTQPLLAYITMISLTVCYVILG